MTQDQQTGEPHGEVGPQRRGDLFDVAGDGGAHGDASGGDEVASADRLAARRRTRLVRQRIVFAVLVVAVLAAGAVGALSWTGRWSSDTTATRTPAPAPSCVVVAPAPLLAADQVRVSVLNGTTRRGLAGAVAAELRTRGFVVAGTGNAEVAAGPVTATVHHPPQLLDAARTVAARLPAAQLTEDAALGEVEVTLGDDYVQLLPEDALEVPAPPPPAPGC